MNCLFCNSSNIREANYPRPTRFNDKTFAYLRCNDCSLVFIDPLPGTEDYRRMYDGSYHDEFYFKDSAPDYSGWLELFEKFSAERSVLDYGCGDGSFLRYFSRQGYECTGVEYDPELVARLRNENPGMRFYTTGEFWALEESKKFNAIFMGDVLEHIAQPSDFLKQLMGKLKKGGLISAQGPLENNANLALGVRKLVSRIKTGGRRTAASHVPYHISFSNARNQKAVFESSGLNTKYYEVFETAWPFPAQFSSSPSRNFMHLVARTSMLLSRSLPGKMGNRFLYIGQKN